MPAATVTEFGAVTIGADSVSVRATPEQLDAWAHRTGNVWPCSVLAETGPGDLVAEFDSRGLVDLYETDGPSADIPGDELNAWSSDVLRDVLPDSHPCYFVTVAQFDE